MRTRTSIAATHVLEGTGQARPGRSRVFMFGLVLALVIAVGYVVYAIDIARGASGSSSSRSSTLSGSPLVGRQAPNFALPVLANAGGQRVLGPSDFAGRPLVINFFASWCGPCNVETPMIARLAAQAIPTVSFLGVDENDTPANALRFVARYHVGYPIVTDQGSLQSKYLLVGIPDTFFVAPNGKVIGAVQGQISKQTLELWLRRLAALAPGHA
jgi:cytochrome c biogenesis protein CcmG/thiol:disulfide interchange protein DsbE